MEFISCFQLDKLTLFNVRYSRVGQNVYKDFTTSVDHFMKNKKDFDCCGQAQAKLLKAFPEALSFWHKWDTYHLQTLSESREEELLADIENLKKKYNYLFLSFHIRPSRSSFNFYEKRGLSIQKIK